MDTAIFLPLDESQVITLAHQLTNASRETSAAADAAPQS